MSFAQNTNSFFIKGTIDPEQKTKLGTYGFDCKFILDSGELLTKEDYEVPPNQEWQIGLSKVQFVHLDHCFHFPSADNAKTKEWNNVYDLYEIELDYGALRFWPILEDGNTHPWYPNGLAVLADIEEFAKPFAGSHTSPPFIIHNYFKAILLEDIHKRQFKSNYNYVGVNKFAGGMTSATDKAAPVLRCNLLNVLPRLGYKINPETDTYSLTATQFVHVLNNLFDTTELDNFKKSLEYMGVDIWDQYPNKRFFGRNIEIWQDPLKMMPKFNIVCNKTGINGGKFVIMEIKVPLSLQYIAFGSILKNICGFQTLSKTPEVIDTSNNNTITRGKLSIIYNARQNSFIAPGKVEKIQIDDATTKWKTDKDAIIISPQWKENNITNADRKLNYHLWLFPKIPVINGKENDFKALITTESGNSQYDFFTLQGQNPINPLNAGDIFFYSSSTLIKWTHIGNYQSPLIAHTPAPVYGFGLSNLEANDPTKTVELDSGVIQIEFECDQIEYNTITESSLTNFNVDPRNAYGDRVQIPLTMMDFSIKRVR